MSILQMNLDKNSYDIVVERGAILKVSELINLDRKVLILTDEGVPESYTEAVAAGCKEAHIMILPQGEDNKCLKTYAEVLKTMVVNGFSRGDCVVAVGGGVIGDLAGFVASTYMRGVDFYNVPTTLLSQIDSSIGGKVAVDFEGYKNIVGAFYQPKGVVIDPDVLKTLPKRQVACGMAEAIKMFATSDAKMFEKIEQSGIDPELDQVILSALNIKKSIVEEDEKEEGLRKVLNFGHTVGHAIERISGQGEFPVLHGECVGIGMLCMSSPEVRRRLTSLLQRYELPTAWRGEVEALKQGMLHDKKAVEGNVDIIRVEKIGSFEMESMSPDRIIAQSREVLTLV